MQRTAKVSLVLTLVVAACAAVITWRFAGRESPAGGGRPAAEAALRRLAELEANGWTREELPLSNTELGQAAVEKILRYDAVGYHRFRSGDREFAVYLVYWEPGKVDLRAVNAHTPDTCWVQSGWETRLKRSAYTGQDPADGLQAGEYRCYANSGVTQYVAFWHLLGGEAVPMWRNGFPRPGFMWRLFTRDRAKLGAEQYFIRVSSSVPFEEIWTEPAFQRAMGVLRDAGLREHAEP